jgi:hypothetical protein
MSIRGPAIALTTLVLLTGCGKAASSCARAVEHHPPSFNSGSAARDFKSLELSPRPTSDELGAAARDRHHDGTGHKLTEEAFKEAMKEAGKHHDNDDKKRDENRQKR